MEYHGNFLDTEFKDENFLNKFKVLKTRKSRTNPWTHYLVVVEENKIEEVIKEVKENLISQGFYAHLYNQDGSKVIVIFPDRVFRTNKENLNEAKEHGSKLGIPEKQLDFKPLTFEEEENYYREG
jgi:hypothetical protein